MAGVVEAVGPGVTLYRPGDEVLGMPLFPHLPGAYAEYVVGPGQALRAQARTVLSFEEAAGLPLAALTAWQGLVDTGKLKAGQRVLIHAAAGGVGHLAVQIAKSLGAYVIGTASAAKHEFVRGLGADEVIDYHEADFVDVLREQPVDIVFDPIAGDYSRRSLKVLKDGGVLVSILPVDDPAMKEAEARGIPTGFTLVEPDRLALTAIVGPGRAGQAARRNRLGLPARRTLPRRTAAAKPAARSARSCSASSRVDASGGNQSAAARPTGQAAPVPTAEAGRIRVADQLIPHVRRTLPGGTRLSADPVAAFSADRAIPTQTPQPKFEALRIHKVLDHTKAAAITQLPLNDLVLIGEIRLFLAFVHVSSTNSTRPSSASTPRSDCQNCSNRLSGTCESHAEKKITSNRVSGCQENTSATSNADIRRSHAVTSDSDRLGRQINRRDRVGRLRQRLRPQAGPTCDLQHASSRSHLRNQACDAGASRRDIAIRRHVVLARPAAVVINLFSQNLVGHLDIITQHWLERSAQGPAIRSETDQCPFDTWTDCRYPKALTPQARAPSGSCPTRPRRGHLG